MCTLLALILLLLLDIISAQQFIYNVPHEYRWESWQFHEKCAMQNNFAYFGICF